MKLIKTRRMDMEDGDVLDQLEAMSRIIPFTSLNIDSPFVFNFSGKSVSQMEKEISAMEFKASRLQKEVEGIRRFFEANKAKAKSLQSAIGSKKILAGKAR